MTGATGGSMPVGSGRVFIQHSSKYRTNVLSHSDLHTSTRSCFYLIAGTWVMLTAFSFARRWVATGKLHLNSLKANR